MELSEVALDEGQDLQELLATATKNKPHRTYSHKGRNSRALSLPALKPTRNPATPTNTGVRLQRFRIGNAKSWEIKPAPLVPVEEPPVVREERAEEDGGGGVDEPDHGDGLGHEGVRKTSNPKSEDDITSPVSPPRHSPASPPTHSQALSGSEEPEDPEAENDDDDDLIVLSQRPLGYNPKHDRRTGNGTRSLRRRPYLIFDKTEAKGYKQLKNTPHLNKTPQTPRYRPGDGFSGREAKPNGSNLLTRSGKQSITTPHVGILDLTQSEPPVAKKKRNIRRANLDDNSFVTAPKKVRRPLQAKDANQQPKATVKPPAQVKKSSSVLGVAENARNGPGTSGARSEHTKDNAHTKEGEHTKEGGHIDNQARPVVAKGNERTQDSRGTQDNEHTKGSGHVNEGGHTDENGHTTNQVRPLVAKDSHPPPNTIQEMASDDDEVDMIIIERSDDSQHNPCATLKSHGIITAGEDQNSCETHVSESPPRHLRIRARSESPESPPPGADASGPALGVSQRVFRRVNTQ